jgi:glycosyltransferase involved in cell wall biosynthesis
MDSSLASLEVKGNLGDAPALYNPARIAEKVVHFTPSPEDVRYRDAFAEWGIEIFPYLEPPGSRPRAWRALRALARVFAKLRRERIQLIRGRLPYFGSFAGCLAGRLLGIPSIVSLGGDNRLSQEKTGVYHFGRRRLSYAVESVVLRLCDVVLAPNHFTKDYVGRIIGRERAEAKVRVIPWRIESPPAGAAHHHLLRDNGIPADRDLVVVIGFLNRYKYSDVMFQVASRLGADGTGPAFVFCGDGDLRAAGEEALAGSPHVRFLGWQPRPVVQALLRAAAVVLVPMSGFVLLEAAAEGKAVVTSRVEWHGEIVEDGVNGFLVEPTAVPDWVERTTRLLRDPSLRETMGRRLQQRYEASFSPEVVLAQEVELYRSLARA